jgi:GT2 family glycosyltransferase
MATAEGFEWLLTLDHDTTVPENFLDRISRIATSIAACSDIAAIVPEVSDHGVFISPNIVSFGRSRRLPKGFIGIPKGELAAINSATTWRVRSWREIGGFNPLFWLDYLDLWAYRAIHAAGNRIYVAGDLQVEHELSLLDPDSRMSAARFENYLGARCAFCDLHGNAFESALLTAQLAYKLCAQLIQHESIELKRLTWRHIRQRMLWTRRRRIELWRRDMMKRVAKTTQD